MLRLSTILLLGAVLFTVGWMMSYRSTPTNAQQPGAAPRTEFAADRSGSAAAVSPAPFDGDRAMLYLKNICAIGPRISGSEGMKQQQELLKMHFEKFGGKVELQKFKAKQHSQKQPVDMANLVVSFWPERPRRVILCSHYDTRPIADQEEDMRRWHEPFVSANDGGSGVAFLMELAHHLKELKIEVGVDLVLFDGEEYIFEKEDKYFFGSEHFAGNYKRSRPRFTYAAAILLDMIAGKNAHFPKDLNSLFLAGPLVESVWRTAADQQVKAFLQERGSIQIDDDHVPLNRAGIPAIDIIDFSYKHWHRLTDTPDNCSGEPMVQVSKVLSVWLQRMK